MNPLLSILILLLIVITPPATQAALSEPDNILYGVVSLNSQPITAARTDVVIEARRLADGPALARYRMGSDARAGSFYSLHIPMEGLGPVGNPSAAQNGENLFIVVIDGSGNRQQAAYRIGERGAVQRLDLGTAGLDSDDDFLPDAWELFYFGNLNSDWSTPTANGRIAWENYQAGLNPNSTNDVFRIASQLDGNKLIVSFFARKASGIGFEDSARYYSLEFSGRVIGPWRAVPTYENVLGNNQTVIYQTTFTNAPTFFRAQVSLY